MIFGTSVAILTSAYPLKERGKVLGINIAVTYVGLSLGPPLGGFITHFSSWRLIYAGIAVYSLVLALLAAWKIADEAPAGKTGLFDMPGTVLYGAMLVSLMWGLAHLQETFGAGLFGFGLILMAVFFWWEQRHKNPVLKVSIFRKNNVFMFSNLAALINYSATSAVAFMLSLYLQKIYGFDALTTGLIMIARPVIMAVFSPMTGRLSDRMGARIVASAGMGLCAIGPDTVRPAHPGNAAVAGGSGPHVPRPGLRALLVAQHQRHHELGGQERLRRRLRHGEHDAADRADAEPRHRQPDLHVLHGPLGNPEDMLVRTSHAKHPGGVRGHGRALRHRRRPLPCAREPA
jgi:MFS family permease